MEFSRHSFYYSHVLFLRRHVKIFSVNKVVSCCYRALEKWANLAMSLWSSSLCCWSSAAMACWACCCIPCTKCCMCWKASIWNTRDRKQLQTTGKDGVIQRNMWALELSEIRNWDGETLTSTLVFVRLCLGRFGTYAVAMFLWHVVKIFICLTCQMWHNYILFVAFILLFLQICSYQCCWTHQLTYIT